MWKLRHRLQRPEGDGGSGGAPAPAPAAPAPAPAASPAPAPAPSPTPAPAPADASGFWNDAWRERLAGSDSQALQQLQRYGSPEDIWKKARSLEQRLSSGEYKPVLRAEASAEEISAYRKAHGIPEAADKYELKDVKIADEDKPFIAEFMKNAHATHQTPAQVAAAIKTFYDAKKVSMDAQVAADTANKTKTEDALRSEWGGDYRKHLNMIEGMLDYAGVNEQILQARMPNGKVVGGDPAALKMLLSLALIHNPAGVVVPGGSGAQEKGIEEEIKAVEDRMRKDRAGYNKDEKQQARYRDLLEARDRMKGRTATA